MSSTCPALPRLREALVAFDGFEMRGPWVGCLEDHAAVALAVGDAAWAEGDEWEAAEIRRRALAIVSAAPTPTPN